MDPTKLVTLTELVTVTGADDELEAAADELSDESTEDIDERVDKLELVDGGGLVEL